MIHWKRKWDPTPVFLPEKSHGQRSPVGYSPWGHKELDTTKSTKHTHTQRKELQKNDSSIFLFLSLLNPKHNCFHGEEGEIHARFQYQISFIE